MFVIRERLYAHPVERRQYIRNMNVRNIILYRSPLRNTSNAFNNLTPKYYDVYII